jgi:hypothetical protein
MIGKSILHYKIIEKPGSPREIIIFKISESDNVIFSAGKPHDRRTELACPPSGVDSASSLLKGSRNKFGMTIEGSI